MHVPLNSRPACAQRSTVPHWKNIPSIARKLSSPSIGQIAHWLKSSPSGFEERPAQEPPQLRRSCSMGTCQPKPCQSLPRHKIHTVVSMRWGGTKNGELLARVGQNHLDIFLTGDKNMDKRHRLDCRPFAVRQSPQAGLRRTGHGQRLLRAAEASAVRPGTRHRGAVERT